jgi:hypothetical protein
MHIQVQGKPWPHLVVVLPGAHGTRWDIKTSEASSASSEVRPSRQSGQDTARETPSLRGISETEPRSSRHCKSDDVYLQSDGKQVRCGWRLGDARQQHGWVGCRMSQIAQH